MNTSMNTSMNTNETTPLTITGTITRECYLSLSRYFISWGFRLGMLAALVLGNGFFLYLCVKQTTGAWLMWLAIWSSIIVTLYRRHRKVVISNVLYNLPGLEKGRGFDVAYTFAEDGLRVHNRGTGLDNTVDYAVFRSWRETKECVALFTKEGSYVLIPLHNMTTPQHDAMMALLAQKCPGLKKRIL